jgi:hypothetical protein
MFLRLFTPFKTFCMYVLRHLSTVVRAYLRLLYRGTYVFFSTVVQEIKTFGGMFCKIESLFRGWFSVPACFRNLL